MSKKAYILMAVVVVLSLAACSRSASNAPVATATQRIQGANATPGVTTNGNATEDPMALVKLFATQTAMASGVGVTTSTLSPTQAVGTPGTPGATSVIPPTGIPSTQAVVTPYPTLVRPTTYTLQLGEYPYCIARRYNINPDELLQANNLTEAQASALQAGTVLTIPQAGSAFPGSRAWHPHPATYVVTVNDTIYRIACYFGDVDPLAIASVNHLVSPYTLTVGQSISIP